jgi:hypothetical protein
MDSSGAEVKHEQACRPKHPVCLLALNKDSFSFTYDKRKRKGA